MFRLKQLREERKITQANFANFFNLSPSTIGMYEQGRRSPDVVTLKKFADFFNVSTDYLLGRDFSSADTTPENENIEQKEDIKEICALFEKLPDNKKALVLQMARVMLEDKI